MRTPILLSPKHAGSVGYSNNAKEDGSRLLAAARTPLASLRSWGQLGSAAQRLCRRLAVAGGVGSGEPAEIGEAPIEGNRSHCDCRRIRLDQGLVGPAQPHLTQIRHRRHAEMTLETLL